jgi:transposase
MACCLAAATDDGEEKQQQHRRTTDELRDLAKSVRDGTYKYDGKPRKSLDWASYNEAQLNELTDTLNLIRKFVDRASVHIPERQRRGGRGRPPVPARDVAKALLLQACFGVSDRVAAGLVRLFREKLGISREFSYKTIERGYDPGPVSELLREVFRLTNEYGNSKETTFAFDGTGEPTSTKVNYESARAEQRRRREEEDEEEKKKKKPEDDDDDDDGSSTTTTTNTASSAWPTTRHDFQYGVSSVGIHTLMYGAFNTTSDHSVSEFSRFSSLVAETRINCPSFETALADSLYANRVACEVASRYGVKLYSLPKTNATYRSHGVPSWMEMTYEFVDDPHRFLGVYHDRSLAETSHSIDKTKFPWKIRRRIPHRKDAASSLRRYVHNIRRYGYLGYLKPELVIPLPNE